MYVFHPKKKKKLTRAFLSKKPSPLVRTNECRSQFFQQHPSTSWKVHQASPGQTNDWLVLKGRLTNHIWRRRGTLGPTRPLHIVRSHSNRWSDHADGRMLIPTNKWPSRRFKMVGPTIFACSPLTSLYMEITYALSPKTYSYLPYMERRALRSWNLNSKIFPIRKNPSYKGSIPTPIYKHQTSFSQRYVENS